MNLAVSITAPQFSSSVDGVLEAARVAEEGGLDGLFLFDHLVPLDDPRRPVLELASTLGAVAASTSRIKIGTLVLRAPLRGAQGSVEVLRTAAAIAPGRLVAGVGAGDAKSAEEAERFGQTVGSLDERVAAVEETVSAVRAQGITAWVGGLHPKILAAAEQADGWNAWALPVDRYAELAGRVAERRPDLELTWGGPVLVGRDDDEVERLVRERGGAGGAIAGTPAQVADRLHAYVEAGARHLVLSVLPNRRDRWEIFVERLRPRLA